MAYMSKREITGGTVVPVGSNLFGICLSSSTASTKIVVMPDFDVLVEGVTIHVYMSAPNDTIGTLMKVGSTEAKAIRYNGNQGGSWVSGSIVSFTYYGDYWTQNDYQENDNTTYTLSLSGNTITLNGSDGSTSSVTIPDDDTTYSMSLNGHTLTLTGSDGSTDTVTLPDDDTKYSLSLNDHTLTLTGTDGSTDSETLPDNNTTYTLSKSGSTIKLTGSDGSETSVSDNNTLYRLSTGEKTLATVNIAAGSFVNFSYPGLHYPDTSITNMFPMGIVGVRVNGTLATYCVIEGFELQNRAQNSCDIWVRIRNTGSSQASVSVVVEVLWWGTA